PAAPAARRCGRGARTPGPTRPRRAGRSGGILAACCPHLACETWTVGRCRRGRVDGAPTRDDGRVGRPPNTTKCPARRRHRAAAGCNAGIGLHHARSRLSRSTDATGTELATDLAARLAREG